MGCTIPCQAKDTMSELYPTKYEGYFVDRNGNVFSFRVPAAKSSPEKRVDMRREPKKLSYKVNKDGYYEVTLSVNCKRYCKRVHQLICETFHGEAPEGCVVDHINRNRQDNRPENLRWLNQSKNSDGQKGRKTSSCVRCLYDGHLYGSIHDALKVVGMNYFYFHRHKNEISHIVSFEGVETIEILKVSRVGRRWLPTEAQTTTIGEDIVQE